MHEQELEHSLHSHVIAHIGARPTSTTTMGGNEYQDSEEGEIDDGEGDDYEGEEESDDESEEEQDR